MYQVVDEFLACKSFDILIQDAVRSYETVAAPFVASDDQVPKHYRPMWKRVLKMCFGVFWTFRNLWRMYRLGIPTFRSRAFMYFTIQFTCACLAGILDGLFPIVAGWGTNRAVDIACQIIPGWYIFVICGVFLLFNLSKTALRVCANYFSFKMMVAMRVNITNLLHGLYLNDDNKMYYVINDLDHRLKN